MAGRPAARGGTADWLVVYGSLMRDLPPNGEVARARGFAPPDGPDGAAAPAGRNGLDLLDQLGVGAGLRRIGPCRFSGALFDLGPYPALRRAPGDEDLIRGELHALLDPGIFDVLDAFEGYRPGDPAGSDYLRERIELLEPRGVSSWIYVYNRPLAPECRVAGGDWRAHLAERGASAHDPASARAAKGGDRWGS